MAALGLRTPRVAVVGAGVAGLVAALELARAGLDVRVLERAAGPGGKLRPARIGEGLVDAGPTVFTMLFVFEELWRDLGRSLETDLTLRPLEVLARHAWGEEESLDLFADPARSEDAVAAFAGPAEARGYRAFRERARRTYEVLERSFIRAPRPSLAGVVTGAGLARLPHLLGMSPFASLWDALGDHFRDPRLRQLFARYATYCGSSPFSAPATLMLVAHVESQGVWALEGGMHRLAAVLERLARERGARFRYGAEVTSIEAERGRAAGIVLADGERVDADAVVFGGDEAALGAGLLGEAGARVAPSPGKARSLSALTWAIQGEASGFPLARHTVFFGRDYREEFDAIFRRGALPAEPTTYVCAQDREGEGEAPAGPERFLCLVNAPAVGGSLDPAEIGRCEERTFALMARCGLTIRRGPGTRLTTPADFSSRFPGTAGALYGRASHGWRASFERPPARTRLPGLYSRGQRPPGTGRADGGPVRTDRGGEPHRGPRFDGRVAPDGYVWWYVDGLSDDGRHGITLIAFLGSVFSPYYALARRRGPADPLRHCALNVALYGSPRRWAMTERGAGSVRRDASCLAIGPSALVWDGTKLTIQVAEMTAPLPSRLRGTVTLYPNAVTGPEFVLDPAGRHRWWPIAPAARVEVAFEQPGLSWSGTGYFDTNGGDTALERDFASWHWCRAPLGRGAGIVYEAACREGPGAALALRCDPAGAVEPVDLPPPARLPRTRLWRVERPTRADPGAAPSVRATLEDTPFYARSAIATRLFGEDARAMHESLSLDRFRRPVVQAMLACRIPRRA